ncbi:MAG: 50S ribosomal protein L13 [Deltaproteobacteria bacterium]|nr:MAG: 50S ribosomal protein L13 [Deltaproteobacteria bacterium]
MNTQSTKKEEALQERRWFEVDATQMVLGRLASEIANLLRGKHKVAYTPHTDTGDFVIVKNAVKVVLTGMKNATKVYYEHSGHVDRDVEFFPVIGHVEGLLKNHLQRLAAEVSIQGTLVHRDFSGTQANPNPGCGRFTAARTIPTLCLLLRHQ